MIVIAISEIEVRVATRKENVVGNITSDASGAAALSICESLLLCLTDRGILPEREVVGILEDAAAAHAKSVAGDGNAETHEAVAVLIAGILDGGNSVRRR